jgi:hypothetical protein
MRLDAYFPNHHGRRILVKMWGEQAVCLEGTSHEAFRDVPANLRQEFLKRNTFSNIWHESDADFGWFLDKDGC